MRGIGHVASAARETGLPPATGGPPPLSRVAVGARCRPPRRRPYLLGDWSEPVRKRPAGESGKPRAGTGAHMPLGVIGRCGDSRYRCRRPAVFGQAYGSVPPWPLCRSRTAARTPRRRRHLRRTRNRSAAWPPPPGAARSPPQGPPPGAPFTGLHNAPGRCVACGRTRACCRYCDSRHRSGRGVAVTTRRRDDGRRRRRPWCGKLLMCPNEMVPLQIDRARDVGRYLFGPPANPSHRMTRRG
jgi:hypothetical protein